MQTQKPFERWGMVQWIKAFATKPDDLNSISRTYMVEGKKESLKVVLWCPYMHHGTYDSLNKQMLKTKETDSLER